MIDESLQEVVQELDKLNKKQKICEIIAWIILLISFFVVPFLSDSDQKTIFISIHVGLISMAIVFSYISKYRKYFRIIYKAVFVEKILNEKLDNVHYDWKTGFEEADLYNFEVITYDLGIFLSDDYLKANYGGIDIRQSDGCQSTPGGRSAEIIFKGKVMQLSNLSLDVNGVWCYTKKMDKRLHYSPKALKAVTSKDSEFARAFDTYTSNAADVDSVLSPQLKKNLLLLAEKYDSFGICFKGNKLAIAMNDFRDSFDVEYSWRKIDYEAEIRKVRQDVDDIIEIIELFAGSCFMKLD